MDKKDIKNILRESLLKSTVLSEDEKKKNIKKDYADIQHAMDNTGNPTAPTQVGVMKDALGWEDDEAGTNRSLFGKMLHQELNDEGSVYQFDDQQLAKVRASLKLN